MFIFIVICASSKALAISYYVDVLSLLLDWELLKGRKGFTSRLCLWHLRPATKSPLRHGIPYNLSSDISAGSILVESSSHTMPGLAGALRRGALGTHSMCWIGLWLLLPQYQERGSGLGSAYVLLIYQAGWCRRFPEARVEISLGT